MVSATQWSYPARTYTEAPAFTRPEGGLLDAATVITVAAGDPRLRGYLYESHAGEVTDDDVTFASASATADWTVTDHVEDIHFTTSLAAFTISNAISLNLIEEADGQPSVQQRVEERFAAAEGIKVESTIWVGPLAAAATEIVAGTALKPSKALGLAAEWIGTRFAGVPYFHVGRRVANEVAANQLTVLPDDGLAVAKVKGGGVLVNGAGYIDKAGPTGATAATADQAWLYVSGTPLLVRGPVTITDPAPDYVHNQDRAYAIRTYVPSFDGVIGAVLVDLS